MNQLNLFLAGHAEAVLFVAVFAEQIGVPLPAIPILLAAGALIADGALNPLTAVGITVVASVMADLLWYYLGRHGGGGMLQCLRKVALCDGSTIEKSERLFAKHGMWAVAGAKFVPWLGFFVPPLAGIFRIRLGKFLTFDALGSLVYAVVYLALGFLFDREINRVLEFVRHFGTGTAVMVSILGILFVAHKFAHRRKAVTSAAASPLGDLAPMPRA
jgi:membrane protein DedA with SNARE-associated domain